MRYSLGGLAAGLFAAATLSVALPAQNVARRVNAVADGDVRMTFVLQPDICGGGNGFSRGDSWRRNDFRSANTRDVEWESDCSHGPGRLVVERQDGETTKLRFYVGGRWRERPNVTDLGQVPNREAANYLLDMIRTGRNNIAKEAIMPLTIIDSVEVWPELLRLARDDNRNLEVRKGAVFWLGQMAAEQITGGLRDVAEDDKIERDVRESAIFALSQRPKQEGVPALIRIVRTSRDPKLRKSALFWLGQSNDPRAVDLIEELLSKR